MSLHRLAEPLYRATQATSRIDGQLDDSAELLADHADVSEGLTEELDAIQAELEAISDGLSEARSHTGVASAIQGSSTLPTEDQLWQIDEAWRLLPPLIERLNALITDRIPAFNAALDDEGVRADPGAALPVPRRGGG
jgi:septation ring formation regulator EzrA